MGRHLLALAVIIGLIWAASVLIWAASVWPGGALLAIVWLLSLVLTLGVSLGLGIWAGGEAQKHELHEGQRRSTPTPRQSCSPFPAESCHSWRMH